jgi:hypothetical protein
MSIINDEEHFRVVNMNKMTNKMDDYPLTRSYHTNRTSIIGAMSVFVIYQSYCSTHDDVEL